MTLQKLTKEMSEKDGEDHYILWGRSITGGTTDKITLSINNKTTGKSCDGVITVNKGNGASEYVDNNSSFKFD